MKMDAISQFNDRGLDYYNTKEGYDKLDKLNT